MDRRGFCQLAMACAAGLAWSACTDGGLVIQTGAIGDEPDARPPGSPDASPNHTIDARTVTTHDAAEHPPDATEVASSCTGTPQDCGAPSSITTSTPTLFSNKFFVCRDANGIFAVTAKCTHQGATMEVSGSEFYCPRHGAEFTFAGAVISGPTNTALAHYSVCLLPNGHVGVDTSTKVAASTRLDA